MRLKSFYAKTMREAMQMVRDTLGEDAVIVATREENHGKSVRVTAAVEQSDSYGNMARQQKPREDRLQEDWLQYDTEEDETAVIEQLTDVMLRHSVPDEITDQVISCATVMGLEQADISLVAALEHLFSFRPLLRQSDNTAHMMIGPPGAGKTLAVAKLAARSVMDGFRVAVISTDTIRAGGIEQLSSFTKLLRIDLQKAETPKDLKAALDTVQGADHIFIDTGGTNPFEPEQMRDLARLIAVDEIEPVLVMPAGIDADESGEIGRIYATLGVHSMIPTRLDIARRLGGLLGTAHHGGLVFADASNTPKVADGLIQLSPQRLTQLLMPRSSRKEQRPPQTRKTTKTAKTG